MQGKAGNYVDGTGIGWEGRDIEGAGVRGVHPCAIWESGDDWHGGWKNIGGRRVSSQKMASGAGVKDGPAFDGGGIGVDRFQKDSSCKGVVVGGDRTRICKNNIGVYFIAVFVRP